MIIKRFKKRSTTSKIKKMAKSRMRTKYKSYTTKRSNIVSKIPIIGKIVNNRRVQKGATAVGTVELITGLAQLVPIPAIQTAAQSPILKTGMAYAIGDIEGAAFQAIKDSGGLVQLAQKFKGLIPGQSQQNGSSSSANGGL